MTPAITWPNAVWSPASVERDESPDVTQLREVISHAAPIGADVTVKNASPAVIAWVRSQPGASFGYTESGDFLTTWFVHASGIWVSAQSRRGERGWIEPESKEAA